MLKRWVLRDADEAAVSHLQSELHIHSVLCKLLVQRGITTYDAAKRFFRPNLSHLHDPFLMKDMDKAVERIEEAIARGEKIMLYGDYDVDGTTSVAVMYEFLEQKAKKLDYYIPDRYKEGYGVSIASIDYAKQNAVKLIIAMDCGIKAHEPIALAKKYGIDFIVCDHHVPDDELPVAVAVLDPKRVDCSYPFKELSGCGIAFKLAQAFSQKQDIAVESLVPLLDLVVVSIACDMVSLTDENRVLAHFGLQQLNENGRLGLKALIKLRGKEYPLQIIDLVFGLGPLINAAGRLSDAKLAVRLMLAHNRTVAQEYANLLAEQNTQRREFELEIMKEVAIQNEAHDSERQSIILYSPEWHKGIIGIVAARVSEQYHRPTVILTDSEDKIVGSVRSVPGFDVYEALQKCAHLLNNFGGHAYAAGLTMPHSSLETFKAEFETAVNATMLIEQQVPELDISSELPLAEATVKFYNILKQFAPFGPNNMRPIFLAKQVRDSGKSILSKNELHALISINQNGLSEPMQGVGFGMGSDFEKIQQYPFDLCYILEENVWRGKMSVRFQVRDARFPDTEIQL